MPNALWDSEHGERLRVIMALVRRVGEEIEPYYGKPPGKRTKDDETRVSDMDFRSADRLLNGIGRRFPELGFVEEEYKIDDRPFKRYCATIDGLDSSSKYADGTGLHYSVLVSLLDGNSNYEPVLGVCLKPEFDEMVFSLRGFGAFIQIGDKEPVPIKVATTHEVQLIASGSRGSGYIDRFVQNIGCKGYMAMNGSAKFNEVLKGDYQANASQLSIFNFKPVTLGWHPPHNLTRIWDLGPLGATAFETGAFLSDIYGNELDWAGPKTDNFDINTTMDAGVLVSNSYDLQQQGIKAGVAALSIEKKK
jgi:3'-phosphoadenosine 5'-phosphosulfate (PAPS) 3'-phosphatase